MYAYMAGSTSLCQNVDRCRARLMITILLEGRIELCGHVDGLHRGIGQFGIKLPGRESLACARLQVLDIKGVSDKSRSTAIGDCEWSHTGSLLLSVYMGKATRHRPKARVQNLESHPSCL